MTIWDVFLNMQMGVGTVSATATAWDLTAPCSGSQADGPDLGTGNVEESACEVSVQADLDAPEPALVASPASPPPPPGASYKVEYYHLDALGSVRAVTDEQGSVIARHDFLPFGEEFAPQNPPYDRKLFTGQERDFETGLDYFNARMLRPDLGRFMTPDPLSVVPGYASAQDLGSYTYVQNNPTGYVDPTGLWSVGISIGPYGASWSGTGFGGLGAGGLQLGSRGSFVPSFSFSWSFGVPAQPSGQIAARAVLVAAQDAARETWTSQGRETFCNFATWDIAVDLGADLTPLRSPVPGRMVANAKEMAAQLMWSLTYRAVSQESAQYYAEQGRLVLSAWRNPTGGHGHVATVGPHGFDDNVPGLSGPLINNIGAQNSVVRLSKAYGGKWPAVRFYLSLTPLERIIQANSRW